MGAIFSLSVQGDHSVMEHGEAIQLMAAERYLLNELAPEDRDRFEEHFFSCQDCALDVRAGASFVEHSKVALSSPASHQPPHPPIPQGSRWAHRLWPALATAVMILLLGVIGYQNTIQYPAQRSALAVANIPQILPSAVLISSRDAGSPVVQVRSAAPFLLLVDIPEQGHFSSYNAVLRASDGTVKWLLPIAAEAARDTISIRVPGVERSGEYVLAIYGVNSGVETGPEIRHYRFRVDFPKQ